mgnify:FL=1
MKILLTAGPTREAIDPVRYISNRSSGKMGYALAEAALAAGHEVILVSGPVALRPPAGATVVNVVSADEMYDAVHAHIHEVQMAILTAAVADFKPAAAANRKLKKDQGIPEIRLVPTRDILASLGAIRDRSFFLVGFAAETDDIAANAVNKLSRKQCDVIVANDVSNPQIGFESDDNAVTLYIRGGEIIVLPRAKKEDLARDLIRIFCNLIENR